MRQTALAFDEASDDETRADPRAGATRADGLKALEAFTPHMGKRYAARRNYDRGPGRHDGVSRLSPFLRRRLVTEEETIAAALSRHAPSACEKFVQEVFWRTYFKGWLEHRPSVWRDFQSGARRDHRRMENDADLARRYEEAVGGRTGLPAFDAWAAELVTTGYLHNHARMWFASIWIFTLELPWALGADFFLRHLLDGDPASNTLSWRWVAGLHTRGKHYAARAENIARYTEGRFAMHGLLNENPAPLEEDAPPPPAPIEYSDISDGLEADGPPGPHALLIHDDDCAAFDAPRGPTFILGLSTARAIAEEGAADPVSAFAEAAVADGVTRLARETGADAGPIVNGPDGAAACLDRLKTADVATVWTLYAPQGPTRDALDDWTRTFRDAGIVMRRVLRPYDAASWPHATKGFFGLKKRIPRILRDLGLEGTGSS